MTFTEYRPIPDCSRPGEELGYVVGGATSLTPAYREPRMAYQQKNSVLVESIKVDGLQEFISYVFNVSAETSEGSSPPMIDCFMTVQFM